MTSAIFLHRADWSCDDSPAERGVQGGLALRQAQGERGRADLFVFFV